jgi:hypothetical protein
MEREVQILMKLKLGTYLQKVNFNAKDNLTCYDIFLMP